MGTMLHQFRADMPSCRYVFKNGAMAVFENNWYRTSKQVEIDELNAEIAAGLQSIAVIPGQEKIDSDDLDPVAVFKAKIIAEYLANQERSLNNGESSSDKGNVISGMATSKTIAPIASGSISAGVVGKSK